MDCPKHGPLNPDWTSCPYCIREQQQVRNSTGGAPPAPQPLNYSGGGAPAGRAPSGNSTRGAGNYGGGYAGTNGAGYGGPGFNQVTHGPDVYGYGGVGAPPRRGATRIIDEPPSAKKKIRAWLIEKEGPRPDQVFPVNQDVTWIGRETHRPEDIFIDDDAVSGQHAKLWVEEDHSLHLLNISTSNGTRVNGVRVEAPVELQENDEIRVGETVLVLKRIDAPLSRDDGQTIGDPHRTQPVESRREPAAAPPTGPGRTRALGGEEPVQEPPPTVHTGSRLTPEAWELLEAVRRGGVPSNMTERLRQIGIRNGIPVTPDTTPNQLIEELQRREWE